MYGLVSLEGYGSDTNIIEVVSNNGIEGCDVVLVRCLYLYIETCIKHKFLHNIGGNLIRWCGIMYIRSGIGLKCKRACQAPIIRE